MSLSDALAREGRPAKGPRCTLCTLLDSLDKTDRTALEAALVSDYTSAGIARALRSEGHNIGLSTVARHRKGECLREPR